MWLHLLLPNHTPLPAETSRSDASVPYTKLTWVMTPVLKLIKVALTVKK